MQMIGAINISATSESLHSLKIEHSTNQHDVATISLCEPNSFGLCGVDAPNDERYDIE